MNIGIAGAGLLGRLLAFQLASAGHDVTVCDPAPGPGARGAAGWTAAGMLSPAAEMDCADASVFALGLRSIDLWPGILARLDAPVEMHRRGSLLLAHRGDAAGARHLLERIARKVPEAPVPLPLDAAALHSLEPSVDACPHAWLIPGEGQIHAVQAMDALARSATSLGVRWLWSTQVSATESGRLRTAGGALDFDWVFDVRGTGARPQLPVRGVRGEIFWLHAPGVHLSRPVRLVHPRHRVYLVPRQDDIVVVGASEIESDDRSPVSLRSTVELLAAAHSVVPQLAEARIVHSEANLRPAMPDNLPLVEHADGLTRINGLFRHGWLIAPALVQAALEALDVSRASRKVTS